VYPYPCIRLFHFAKSKIHLFQSSYQNLLEIGKSRKGAIFLDIGSCMGTDARKLIADGYPLEQVVTSDLRQEFANLGHKLFKTTQETYPIAFVPGDVFDPNHLEIAPPTASSAQASTGAGDPPSEKQLHLARALAGLLSPEPGSIIFGLHRGAPEKGFQPSLRRKDHRLWCHSPESWTELWDGVVFEKGCSESADKIGAHGLGKFTAGRPAKHDVYLGVTLDGTIIMLGCILGNEIIVCNLGGLLMAYYHFG
ncbi:hypothetical protein F5888DRAFT_1637766, partial [Russula emetica]